MKSEKTEIGVLLPEMALDTYLHALLEEVSPVDDLERADRQQRKPVAKIKTISEQKVHFPVPVVAPEKPVQKSDKQSEAVRIRPLSVMPVWSHQSFDAISFRLNGATLAVPLIDLLRTVKLTETLTKLPGQPGWFLGLVQDQGHQVAILDTAQLMFGKSLGGLRDVSAKPFHHILISADARWGLVCDEVLTIQKLRPELVRWRTSRQKRPWLAGTVIETLTPVIDVSALLPLPKAI